MENYYGTFKCPEFDLINFGIYDTRIAMPKGGISEERTVENFEIEFVTLSDKSARTYLDGTEHPILQGTFICAKPGMRRKSRLHFKCFYIHFQTSNEELKRFVSHLPDYAVINDISQITKVFEEFITVDKNDFSFENRLRMQYFVSRILYIIKTIPELENSTGANVSIAHRTVLNQVERHIRHHLSDNLELNSLAKIANLSPIYFHKMFCEFYGVSPAKYVLDQRIERAKTLLLTSEKSMIEISAICGFSSQSYFNYKFKEICGVSPLKFRKSMLSKKEI